jgi:aspartate dehydrogenase
MKLAFVGFGTIGRIIFEEIGRRESRGLTVAGVLDPALTDDEAARLQAQGVTRLRTLEELLGLAPDLVVEAASQQAAREWVPELLARGLDVLSMSVGAYLDPATMARVRAEGKGRLFLSSGALPGADVLKAAAVRGITRAELTTRKAPRALAGAPGLAGRAEELAALREPRVVFEGSAAEAVRLFPANVNIAATLSLAGIGPERTRVTIVADPAVTTNIHQVHLEGAFGSYRATVECLPSSNPKTSLIAALSAVALLENLAGPIRIGT